MRSGIGRLWLLFLLTLPAPTAWAQAPTWQWATSPGTGGGYSTAVDGAGNVYVTGRFSGTATFGTTTLTSVGSWDVYVAKLTPGGTYLWAVSVGGSSYDEGYGVAVDGSGNVYVTGTFQSPTATFGSTTLTRWGFVDGFVAKLSPAGTWLWATSTGGGGYDEGRGVAVDGSGNVVVTGYFAGSATFGATTLLSAGGSDVFMAKLSPTGVWQWARSAGGRDTDTGFGMAVDGSGNVVATGYFRSSATFGATTLLSAGDYDVFVVKLSPAGAWLWATSAGWRGDDEVRGVAVDGSGNVVVTGYFSNSATFGPTTLTSAGGSDVFVAKLSPAGAWQWATSAGGSGDDIGKGVAVDGSGNVVVTGRFSSSATFGPTTLLSAGSYDVFVAKLSPAGAWQWATHAGGVGYDEGYGVAVDAAGNAVVTGYFSSPTATFGSTMLTNPTGNYTVFIARLSNPTGLPDDAASPGFTLSPNPAHHMVQLTNAPAAEAEIVDALGRTVRAANLELRAANLLDLTGLPPGLYVVRCGQQTRRLVVE